jgi:hypothetical protein
VATDVGLSVVDITQRDAPREIGKIKLGAMSWGLAQQGNLVFVANSTKGLRVIDVSNPAAPVEVGAMVIPGSGGARDVAVKDGVVYVARFAGEIWAIRHSPAPVPPGVNLTFLKRIGLPAWGYSGPEARLLERLRNLTAGGNAKVLGVAITGNTLVTLDAAYGRLFFYDVTDAANPAFAGTHRAPYMLRAEVNPTETVAFGLSAFGGTSGIYSVPTNLLGPDRSTTYRDCATCDYFQTVPTDYGGLTVSGNGRYVVYVGSRGGVVQVIDVRDPANLVDAGSLLLPRPGHGSRLFDSLGAQTLGNHIFAAVGALGFYVYSYSESFD